jgi:hypothetical protein
MGRAEKVGKQGRREKYCAKDEHLCLLSVGWNVSNWEVVWKVFL